MTHLPGGEEAIARGERWSLWCCRCRTANPSFEGLTTLLPRRPTESFPVVPDGISKHQTPPYDECILGLSVNRSGMVIPRAVYQEQGSMSSSNGSRRARGKIRGGGEGGGDRAGRGVGWKQRERPSQKIERKQGCNQVGVCVINMSCVCT